MVTISIRSWLVVLAIAATGPAVDVFGTDAASRLATYRDASGTDYFALALQPGDHPQVRQALSNPQRSIVVLVDTSASQMAEYRQQSLDAIRGLLAVMPPEATVSIVALDVKATALTPGLVAAKSDEVQAAIKKLERRLPLGHTDLALGMNLAVEQLQKVNGSRAVAYIGDGSVMGAMQQPTYRRDLVQQLRQHKIATHTLLVGPKTTMAAVAPLATHTGGTVLMMGDELGNRVGTQLASALMQDPLWPLSARVPEAFSKTLPTDLPPLRLDRDSVVVGKLAKDQSSGEVVVRAEAGGRPIDLRWQLKAEASNPDMSFLPSLVDRAEGDNGLDLPTFSSLALREAQMVVRKQSEELVKAGELAMNRGQSRGAAAIAQLAIRLDPNSAEAKNLAKAAEVKMTAAFQPPADPFGSGGAADPFAPPAGNPAPAPNAGGNLFGDTPADAPPAAAPPAAAPPAAAPPAAAQLDPIAPAPRAAMPPAGVGVNPEAIDPLLTEQPSGLLDDVQQARQVNAGRLRANVRALLGQARTRMSTDPSGIAGELKVMLDAVNNSTDVPAATRQELADQLRSAIVEASRREVEYVENQALSQQAIAMSEANNRAIDDTNRREGRMQQLAEQVNALIKAGRPEAAAGDVVPEIAEIARTSPVSRPEDILAAHTDGFTEKYSHLNQWYRYKRHRAEAFLNALALNEKALVPFVDEPPIYYPDPEVWQRLSARRLARYGSIELSGSNASERKITQSLDEVSNYTFADEPLESVVTTLSRTHDIPIHLDRKALEELNLPPDTPINADYKNISFRSALRLMLSEHDLTYMIKDEVLMITSTEKAQENLVTRVYPVGDLVIPPSAGMGGGMMGGGMMGGGMGGGMGGMGGGMGGMGGGMGGMGGGMGGMGGMGGGMGGMFAVPDEASLDKDTKQVPASNPDEPIKLQRAADQTVEAAWDAYFKQLQTGDTQAQRIHSSRLRATVGYLSLKAQKADEAGKKSEAVEHMREVRALIEGSMRYGQPQMWMYEALAMLMKFEGADKDELERVLLSAVDIADSPEELVMIGNHMADAGYTERALELYRNAIANDPMLVDAYRRAMTLARDTNNIEAIQWACAGVLSQGWSQAEKWIQDSAMVIAKATERDLREQGRVLEAEQMHRAMEQASARDCIVMLTWTGEADVDLVVQEPCGTICSILNRRTAGGGVLYNDGAAYEGSKDVRGTSETYICAKGFTGVYDIMLRRVYGNVSTGKVTLDIYTDHGRPTQRHIRQTVPLTEKDALVRVNVQEGRRAEPIVLAQLRDVEQQVKQVERTVLAQSSQSNGGLAYDPTLAMELYRDARRLGLNPRQLGFNTPAVGYRPQITVLPEGASMAPAGVVISADRRYVRMSPNPFFSQLGEVNTFNFVTGQGGGGGGGGGGLGGGGGGLGGGGVL